MDIAIGDVVLVEGTANRFLNGKRCEVIGVSQSGSYLILRPLTKKGSLNRSYCYGVYVMREECHKVCDKAEEEE